MEVEPPWANRLVSRKESRRCVRVSVVKDETVESLVRKLAERLDNWGGFPWLFVDNAA
jgi:hypothetical protein